MWTDLWTLCQYLMCEFCKNVDDEMCNKTNHLYAIKIVCLFVHLTSQYTLLVPHGHCNVSSHLALSIFIQVKAWVATVFHVDQLRFLKIVIVENLLMTDQPDIDTAGTANPFIPSLPELPNFLVVALKLFVSRKPWNSSMRQQLTVVKLDS